MALLMKKLSKSNFRHLVISRRLPWNNPGSFSHCSVFINTRIDLPRLIIENRMPGTVFDWQMDRKMEKTKIRMELKASVVFYIIFICNWNFKKGDCR